MLDKIYPISPPPSNTVELHCPSIWHPAAWRPNQHGKKYSWRPAQICMEHLWLLNSALISISWRGDCLLYCVETLLCESVCCTSSTLWRIPGFASFWSLSFLPLLRSFTRFSPSHFLTLWLQRASMPFLQGQASTAHHLNKTLSQHALLGLKSSQMPPRPVLTTGYFCQ